METRCNDLVDSLAPNYVDSLDQGAVRASCSGNDPRIATSLRCSRSDSDPLGVRVVFVLIASRREVIYLP